MYCHIFLTKNWVFYPHQTHSLLAFLTILTKLEILWLKFMAHPDLLIPYFCPLMMCPYPLPTELSEHSENPYSNLSKCFLLCTDLFRSSFFHKVILYSSYNQKWSVPFWPRHSIKCLPLCIDYFVPILFILLNWGLLRSRLMLFHTHWIPYLTQSIFF